MVNRDRKGRTQRQIDRDEAQAFLVRELSRPLIASELETLAIWARRRTDPVASLVGEFLFTRHPELDPAPHLAAQLYSVACEARRNPAGVQDHIRAIAGG